MGCTILGATRRGSASAQTTTRRPSPLPVSDRESGPVLRTSGSVALKAWIDRLGVRWAAKRSGTTCPPSRAKDVAPGAMAGDARSHGRPGTPPRVQGDASAPVGGIHSWESFASTGAGSRRILPPCRPDAAGGYESAGWNAAGRGGRPPDPRMGVAAIGAARRQRRRLGAHGARGVAGSKAPAYASGLSTTSNRTRRLSRTRPFAVRRSQARCTASMCRRSRDWRQIWMVSVDRVSTR